MLRVLLGMANAEREDELDEANITCDGGQCWRGADRTSRQVVYKLMGLMLISDCSFSGSTERYNLNETGKAVLRRPELAQEVLDAIQRGVPFTIGANDRLRDMDLNLTMSRLRPEGK